MATFVLLHGAWHGAWCWRPLIDALERGGHQGVAMDLPAEDPAAGLDAYVDVAAGAVTEPTAGGPVVVVGHSLGGLVAPLVARRLGADHVVHLCALVPVPGMSFDDQVAAESGAMFAPTWGPLTARQQPGDHGAGWWRADDAIEAFYHDCPRPVAADAAARLWPQHWQLSRDVSPDPGASLIAGSIILTTDDRVIAADRSRELAAERFGAPAVELPGGHSPMLSRPAALADALDEVVRAPGR